MVTEGGGKNLQDNHIAKENPELFYLFLSFYYSMKKQDDGLSQESKKFIAYAFSILMVLYLGLGFLMNGKMISPVIFAILAAIFMGITFIVVACVVIRNDGWDVIRSS
jgi:hypothetical protein